MTNNGSKNNDLSYFWMEEKLKDEKDELNRLVSVFESMKNRKTFYAKGIKKMIKLRKELVNVCHKHFIKEMVDGKQTISPEKE